MWGGGEGGGGVETGGWEDVLWAGKTGVGGGGEDELIVLLRVWVV